MIKGISEVRRCPRLGHIRLGILKLSQKTNREYPVEVEYFILDPQTGSQERNNELITQFQKLYGEKPTAIRIMFPPVDQDLFFQQWYKRYGSATLLKCKGDGETATCALPEFAEGLEVIGSDEMGLTKVKCLGPECIYQKEEKPSCRRTGALQVLLPELSGIGVWQINTGSWNSIVNLNSALDWLKGLCGRYAMIPITLRRVPTEIPHEGKKTKHYIMQIDLENVNIAQLQKAALIAPEKSLIGLLPAPDEERDPLIHLNIETNGDKKENLSPDPALQKAKDTFQKAKDTFEATEVFDEYGDLNRFGKDKERAAGIIAQLKEARVELGEKRFMYCLGNSGWDAVRTITKISDLANLYNVVSCEVRSKRSE